MERRNRYLGRYRMDLCSMYRAIDRYVQSCQLEWTAYGCHSPRHTEHVGLYPKSTDESDANVGKHKVYPRRPRLIDHLSRGRNETAIDHRHGFTRRRIKHHGRIMAIFCLERNIAHEERQLVVAEPTISHSRGYDILRTG